MLNARPDVFQSKTLRAMALLAGLFFMTWTLSGWIVSGSSIYLVFAGVACAGFLALIYILKDWRTGVFMFLIWLVFEDLIRKFAGNSLFMFFGKDIIIGMAYVSMLAAKRRGRLALLKPPFLFWLAIFFWWASCKYSTHTLPTFFTGSWASRPIFTMSR